MLQALIPLCLLKGQSGELKTAVDIRFCPAVSHPVTPCGSGGAANHSTPITLSRDTCDLHMAGYHAPALRVGSGPGRSV